MVVISTTSLIPLSAKCIDSNVYFNIQTEVVDGYNLCSNSFLTNIKDLKSSLYSSVVLTNYQNLSSAINILIPSTFPQIILTYIQNTNEYNNIEYLRYNSPGASFGNILDNKSIFEIVLLDNFHANIRYNDNGTLKYLNYLSAYNNFNFTNNINSTFQTFFYFYDDTQNQISLFFQYNGNTYSLCNILNNFQLVNNSQINARNIFNLRPSFLNINMFNNNWVSYISGAEINTAKIGINNQVQNNFLCISNFNDIDLCNNTFNLQILPLKNQITQDGISIKDNIFNTESPTHHRIYNTINLEGNDIILNYSSGVKNLIFTQGKLTYFRFPYVSSPFIKLNVNDSNLVVAGAIAGDRPNNADKIFKQRAADYFNYSISDELNGTWLCAWLSAGPTSNIKPVWVDRYYNPNFINFTNALGYNNSPYVDNTTNTIINLSAQNQIIFDLPSNLVFEPHALYAYHHLGNTDLKNLINTYTNNLVLSSPASYQTFINSSNLLPEIDSKGIEIYNFTGNEYLTFNSLSSISSSSFTLSLFVYSQSYSEQFAEQLLGNYQNNTGIGIFNIDNTLTVNIGISSNQYSLAYPLSGLKFGWHHLGVVFNNEGGYSNFYFDSVNVASVNFDPGVYSFTNLLSSSLSAGLGANCQLKDFKIYNRALTDFEIRNHAFLYSNIRDLNWNAPTGQRQITDSFEKFFRFSLPAHKSNRYNIVIENSGVLDTTVQAAIEEQINNLIPNVTPAYADVNKIIWREDV